MCKCFLLFGIFMIILPPGDGEDGEGDRGAESEGVLRRGGAEEALQGCQVVIIVVVNLIAIIIIAINVKTRQRDAT